MRNKLTQKLSLTKTKRGDTIIEVMLAFAIFSLIAVISITMMNMGLATGERSLELVTARNELNAQAEALRFIHSSYIAEDTLPKCDEVDRGTQCQQYAVLWDDIVSGAMTTDTVSKVFTNDYPLSSCNIPYESESALLSANSAFVINTRQLLSDGLNTKYSQMRDAIVRPGRNPGVFVEPTLNARIIYTENTGSDSNANSTTNLGGTAMQKYTKIAKVEGIWVIPVAGPRNNGSAPQYYDFYIETCWYGSNSPAPTSLDAIIRLYNPEGA